MILSQSLSKEALNLLWERYERGDLEARDRIIEANFGLVGAQAAKMKGGAISEDDLFSVGCVALVQAVDTFDRSRGNTFSTYAVPIIRFAMIKEVQQSSMPIKVPNGTWRRMQELRRAEAEDQQAIASQWPNGAYELKALRDLMVPFQSIESLPDDFIAVEEEQTAFEDLLDADHFTAVMSEIVDSIDQPHHDALLYLMGLPTEEERDWNRAKGLKIIREAKALALSRLQKRILNSDADREEHETS